MKINKWLALAASLIVTLGVGFLSGYSSMDPVDPWYRTLATSVLNPPSWVFGPVWTVLYILMAVALWMVWRHRARHAWAAKHSFRLYAMQLILNGLWSVAFFGLHLPLLAFIDLAFLWIAVASTIAAFRMVSSRAAWLMVPYLAWISFAGYLNLTIVLLNP